MLGIKFILGKSRFYIFSSSIVSFIFLICCESKNYLEENAYSNIQNISVSYDNWDIRVDTTMLQSYAVKHLALLDSIEFLYCYNNANHSLDIFNLDIKSYDRRIKLSEDGPNGVGPIEGVYVQSYDSIFLYSRGVLAIADRFGELKQTFNLFELGQNSDVGELTVNHRFKLQYDSEKGFVFFYVVYDALTRVERPAIAFLDIKDQKVSALPIYYSEYFQDQNGKLGYLNYLNASFLNGNSLTYNFEYESNIYEYNVATEKTKKFGGISENSNGLVSPYKGDLEDHEAHVNHAIENPQYFDVVYDEYRDLYYRFHWKSTPLVVGGKFQSFIDKEMFLIIFDPQFKIISEIEIPSYKYGAYSWLISNKGILIAKSHPLNSEATEDNLSLDIIKIEKN